MWVPTVVDRLASPLLVSRRKMMAEPKHLRSRSDTSRVYDASQSCFSAPDPFDYGLDGLFHLCCVGQVCLEEADFRAAEVLDILRNILQI